MRILFGFMSPIILSLALGAASANSASANSHYANNGLYVAVGADVGSYEHQTPNGSSTEVALNARLGFDLLNHFGIEAEGAWHLGGSDKYERLDDDGGGYESEVDVIARYGVFLRGRAPVSDRWTLFARGGLGKRHGLERTRSYGIYQFDGSFRDTTFERDEGDIYFAFGGGAEFQFTEDVRNAIRAEITLYRPYIGGEDEDIDFAGDTAVSLAYVRRF